MGTRRIIRLDKLSLVMRLERRTSKDSSSGRIMRLVSVVTLETNNQKNYKYWLKFVQTENTPYSIKTAILKSKINERNFSYLQVEPSLTKKSFSSQLHTRTKLLTQHLQM